MMQAAYPTALQVFDTQVPENSRTSSAYHLEQDLVTMISHFVTYMETEMRYVNSS